MTYHIGQTLPLERTYAITGSALPSPKWYALQTHSQRENAVHQHLKAKGIHSCYPKREIPFRVRGKTMKREYPVIPGIVYAKFTEKPHWHVLKARRLIVGVFSWGDQPIVLSSDMIRAVMGIPTEQERLEAARAELMRIRKGDRAEILDGPFEGFTVDVKRVQAGRVWFEALTDGFGFKGEADADKLLRLPPDGV